MCDVYVQDDAPRSPLSHHYGCHAKVNMERIIAASLKPSVYTDSGVRKPWWYVNRRCIPTSNRATATNEATLEWLRCIVHTCDTMCAATAKLVCRCCHRCVACSRRLCLHCTVVRARDMLVYYL